jgi:hypothetical protein
LLKKTLLYAKEKIPKNFNDRLENIDSESRSESRSEERSGSALTVPVYPTQYEEDSFRKHVGVKLNLLLRTTSPLRYATNPTQMRTVLNVAEKFQIDIECIPGDNLSEFDNQAFTLYETGFCKEEILPPKNILKSIQAGCEHRGCYSLRISGVHTHKQKREVIAFMQGGTFHMGYGTCVNFSEYEIVKEDFRKNGFQDVIRIVTNAISAEHATRKGCIFIGRVGEIEYKDQGANKKERDISVKRIETWNHKGALCVLPINKENGKMELLHLQPILQYNTKSRAVPLNLFYRPFYTNPSLTLNIENLRNSYDAYMSGPGRGIRWENLKESRDFFEKQMEVCDIVIKPIKNIPSFITLSLHYPSIAETVKNNFNISDGDPNTSVGRNTIYRLATAIRNHERCVA